MSRVSAKFGMFAACLFSMLLLVATMFGQETTGGLQGTVKDPSGAVVSKAQVVLTGTSLVGAKSLETDNSGYYHFANLPPGTYKVRISSDGLETFESYSISLHTGDARCPDGGADQVCVVPVQLHRHGVRAPAGHDGRRNVAPGARRCGLAA